MELILKGNWNVLKGKLKEKYGELSDHDLVLVEGQEEQMIGRLQKKLGTSKNDLINELNSLIDNK